MRKTFLLLLSVCGLAACTVGRDEKTLRFECEEQFQGQACFQLGQKREGEEALRYYRMGCERRTTAACMAVAARTQSPAEMLRAWKTACELKSEEACTKVKELQPPGEPPGMPTNPSGTNKPSEASPAGATKPNQ